MIDTDKYEGHTEGPWMVCCEDQKSPHPPKWIQADEKSVCSHMEDVTEIDIQLIADAPLLLAEVKRLREEIGDWALVYKQLEGENRELSKRIRELEDDGE